MAQGAWFDTGMTFDSAGRADASRLEQRRPGEHVWIALATYRLSPEGIRKRVQHGLDLDMENLAAIDVGCFVCERAYSDRLVLPGLPRRTGGDEMKRLLLAWDHSGQRRVVGPVHTDDSVAKLRAELEVAGWTVEDGDVPATSAAEFRAERSRGALSCR